MARRSSGTPAVLGVLGSGPFTAYGLVQHMGRSTLQFIWPRAASKLYDVPKRLADQGLAATSSAGDGPVAYSLTKAGKEALAAYVAEPSGHFTYESEAALKVLLAHHGSVEDLLGTLAAVRHQAQADLEVMLDLGARALEGQSDPNRLHTSALVGDLLFRQNRAVLDWCAAVEAEVATWRTTRSSSAKRAQALNQIERNN